MKTRLKSALAHVATLGLMLGLASRARADWLYSFQTAPPPSFITLSIPPSATFSSSVGGGILQLSDTRLPAVGGAALALGLETGETFTDVRVTGTLNPTGTTNNLLNLVARRNPVIPNTYSSGIDFGAGFLQIVKVTGGMAVESIRSTDASQGSQPLLANLARSYFLELDVVGNQLTSRVFDVAGGTQLLVVNYTDTGVVGGPPHASGLAGVSSESTGGRVDGSFGPVGARAIPEPGTLTLFGLGLLGLLAYSWRKRAA
jgi:hypothetical protein